MVTDVCELLMKIFVSIRLTKKLLLLSRIATMYDVIFNGLKGCSFLHYFFFFSMFTCLVG